jgi:hypothetical protein
MRKEKTLLAHTDCSDLRGTLVYENGPITVRKVSGAKEKLYCQNLSLFVKLFIDHKVLYYNINDYEFYVMRDQTNFVGYFSRISNLNSPYNLSCIVVMPTH